MLGDILGSFGMESYFNNTVNEYAVALITFIVLFVVFKLFTLYALKKLEVLAKKTKTQWDDVIVDFIKEIKWFFYFIIALYISIQQLVIPDVVSDVLYYLMVFSIGFYAAKGASKAINHVVEEQVQKRGDQQSSSMMKVLGLIAKVVMWSVALLMILANLGIQITPLIASMGIGGIAIALALQSVLGDLFGAFVIYFDKPFKEGDFIIIGSDMGVVKHIGIKSTRIQALQGQEIVISNQELVNSRVNNYKQMEKRRIAYGFGVTYDTGLHKLNLIKNIVQKLFEDVDGADLDRVHFKEFADYSLNYEVVYYVNTNDYNKYMDIQEQLNLGLYEAFEKAKISFAFPTQTIELAQEKQVVTKKKTVQTKRKK